MSLSDPLGDMLTRIRNAQRARHAICLAPASKLRANVLDVLKRDQSMFLYRRENEATWKVIDPMERVWQKAGKGSLFGYGAGTRGPKAARRLLRPARAGR